MNKSEDYSENFASNFGCLLFIENTHIVETPLILMFATTAGRLTVKADVYSFGVVLLELLSGLKAYDNNRIGIEQNLVNWARILLRDTRKILGFMDSRLEGQYPKKEASTVAMLALQCISNEAKLRPKMSEVLATLEPLQEPKNMTKRTHMAGEKVSDPAARSPMKRAPSPRR